MEPAKKRRKEPILEKSTRESLARFNQAALTDRMGELPDAIKNCDLREAGGKRPRLVKDTDIGKVATLLATLGLVVVDQDRIVMPKEVRSALDLLLDFVSHPPSDRIPECAELRESLVRFERVFGPAFGADTTASRTAS